MLSGATAQKVDVVPLGQADIGFFPVLSFTRGTTKTLDLSPNIDNVNLLHWIILFGMRLIPKVKSSILCA